jgi:hypothetical protein
MSEITHEDLRKAAVKWLSGTSRSDHRCSVVLSEIATASSQIPDAIGWAASRSILIECKVSRSDFFADATKPSRIANHIPGTRRYYLAPARMVKWEELPIGWGLLEYHAGFGSYIRIVHEAPYIAAEDRGWTDEISMLVSALRRIKQREFLVIVPEADAEQRAAEAKKSAE